MPLSLLKLPTMVPLPFLLLLTMVPLHASMPPCCVVDCCLFDRAAGSIVGHGQLRLPLPLTMRVPCLHAFIWLIVAVVCPSGSAVDHGCVPLPLTMAPLTTDAAAHASDAVAHLNGIWL
jgi:hypothetical protein